MKEGIHPTYHPEVTITCSCGAVIITGSTASKITTEVCSACHPFYTGKQKLVDVAGRVDTFKQKLKAVATKQARYRPHQEKRRTLKTAKRSRGRTIKLT